MLPGEVGVPVSATSAPVDGHVAGVRRGGPAARPQRPWTATRRGCGSGPRGGLDGEPSTLAPADGRAAGVLFGIYRFLAGVTG